MTLYYESHITIEPVFDAKLERASSLAKEHGFKIAELLMKKRAEDTPERSQHDTFMTGHSAEYVDLKVRMINLIVALKENGFTLWRYKIEGVVMDSRTEDTLRLLGDQKT